MKKLILTIFVLFCFTVSAYAAGTVTFVYHDVITRDGDQWLQVVATCTADAADGSFPITRIGKDVTAHWLYQVKTYYGATGPTNNSDLDLNEHTPTGYDILNAAGTDMVDNATDNNFKPLINTYENPIPIYGPVFLKITGNSVNSAVVTIVLDFVQ